MLTVKQTINRLKSQPDDLPLLVQMPSGTILNTDNVGLTTIEIPDKGEVPAIVIIVSHATETEAEAETGGEDNGDES